MGSDLCSPTPDVDAAYVAYAGYVRRVLVRCGVPVADAPDLAQEVFVVLLRRVREHRDAGTLRGWLFQTARRVASNYRRSQRRAQARLASAPVADPDRTPEELVARREAASFITTFLDELDEDSRKLFLLSELEGVGGTAIARSLQLNPKTTYSRVYALRRRFDREAERAFGRESSSRMAAVVPWLGIGWIHTLRRGLVAKVVTGVVVLALLVLAWRALRPPPPSEGTPPAPSARWDPQDEKPLRERLEASALEALDAEAILRGRVHDEDGRGIAGADVCGWRHAIDFSYTALGEPLCTRSGSDGSFRLGGVSPGLVRLTATATGFVPGEHSHGSSPALRVSVGERKGLDIELHSGGVPLTGVVQDMTGGSVEGAMVALHAEPTSAGADRLTFGGWGDRPPVVVISGEDGRFATHVAPGAIHWQAFSDGYAATRGETTAPAFDVVIRVVPEAVISGIVRDASTGRPAADVRVVAWTDASSLSNAGGAVRTGPDGRFRIDRLPPGRYKPSATAPGRIGMASHSVALGPGDSDEVEIELTNAPIVSAVVTVAPSGEPCPDGVAGLREDGRGRMEWQVIGDEGRVVFPAVLPGSYHPVVACKGYRSLPFYAPVEAGTKPATDLSWTVTNGARLVGTVVSAAGAPVSGAMVSLMQPDGLPLPRGARTDGNGRFSYEGLVRGTYVVSAYTGDEVLPEPKTLEVSGETEVQLELAAGGSVRGVVLGSSGTPVADAVVTLEEPSRSQGPRVRVGEDGRFTFGALPLSAFTLSASLEDGAWSRTRQRVELSAAEPDVELTLTIDDAVGVVEGRVVDSSGAGIPDALVTVGGVGRGVTVAESSVLTDASGGFRIDDVASGSHSLTVVAPDGASAELPRVVADGPSLEVVLVAPASAAGTIAVDEGALPGAFEVAASVQGERRAAEIFVSPDGRWNLEGLPAGRVTFAAVTGEGRATASAMLKEGEHIDGVVLELGHREDLEGRLFDLQTGEPMVGVIVVATAFDDGYEELGKAAEIAVGIGPSDERQRTDSDGHFVVPKVPVGRLHVAAFPPDFPESTHNQIRTTVVVPLKDELALPMTPMLVPYGTHAGKIGLQLRRGEHDEPWTIDTVDEGGPAAGLGLKPGAAIVSVDGHEVTGRFKYLVPQLLLRAPGGTKVKLTTDDGTQAELLVGSD